MPGWQSLRNAFINLVRPQSSCANLALLKAAAEGNCTELTELLAHTHPHARLNDGLTILHSLAISDEIAPEKRLQVLDILLRHGVDVNASTQSGTTALMYSTGVGDSDFCEALIQRGANVRATDKSGDTPLIWAASTRKLESLLFLIDAGSEVNHRNKLGRTALMYAVRQGTLQHVRELLEHGADPALRDKNGEYPMKLAAGQGRDEVVAVLGASHPGELQALPFPALAAAGLEEELKRALSDGADILARNENGFSALELAVLYKRGRIIQLLLPHYETHPEMKAMALGIACLNKDVALLEILLAQGADPNCPDEVGVTALMHAAGRDFVDGVELLLKHGADKRQQNEEGHDAVDIAQASKSYSALQALYKAP